MAKLTKEEIKLHEQAVRLLEKDVLTFDDKLFVLDYWHEAANHINSKAGAYFTPESIAKGVAVEAHGTLYKRFVDLCAGIGRLAFTVQEYMEPFHKEVSELAFTCVEVNPDYVEIGKKIMPNARWICADVLDLPLDIGHFDLAIGNPPFGNLAGRKQPSPRMKNGPFEYKVIDVASDIADDGVFIIPQSSSPFQFSGRRSITYSRSRLYENFEQDTGIVLDANCGIDCTVEAHWRGVNIVVEIVLADFRIAREGRNPIVRTESQESPIVLSLAGEQVQGELFPMAA